MGWSVRADVNISWDGLVVEQEVKDFMIEERMDVCELHGNHDGTHQEALEQGDTPNGLDFSIWGNKGVNYDCLDAIKNYLKERGVKDFEISANEYSETGGGYYYDSTEDEEPLKDKTLVASHIRRGKKIPAYARKKSGDKDE